MMRHCDGTDPNLIKHGPNYADDVTDVAPCDCGLTFDDVGRLVIWPHKRIATREEREELVRAIYADGMS